MTLLSKFFALSWRQKRCLVLTFLVLHVVRFGLWRLSFQALWQRIQSHRMQPPFWLLYVFPVSPPISEWVQALDTASWYTFKQARCLSRALTLYLLMKWLGHSPTLRIGVAKVNAIAPHPHDGSLREDANMPRATIEAHAWIEHNGQVILGQIRDLERFTQLPSIEQMK